MHKSFTQGTSQTKSFLILEQKLLCKSYKLTQLGLPTFLAPLLPRPPIQLASQRVELLSEGAFIFSQNFVLFMRNFFHLHNIAISIFHEYVSRKVHIFSEGHKISQIFTLLLTVCTVVKSKVKISQNFGAFSEYMNFKKCCT